MRLSRVVVLVVLATFGVLPALPAHAGNWAVTLLDPLPDRVEADRTYTIGYWVLQHGSHPFQGELGRTGLRLVRPDAVLEFEGTALPEAAHYAVAVAVPAGTWRVYAMQGQFAEFEVGTLAVPGALVLKPSDLPVGVGGHDEGGAPPHWGAVHPPSMAADGHHGGAAHPTGGQTQAAAPAPQEREVQTTAAVPQPRSPVAVALLMGGGLVALLAVGLTLRPLRRRLRA